MKQTVGLSLIAALMFAGLVHAEQAFGADKMDLETHSLLIKKLERVVENGQTPDAIDSEVRLRLADLLSERARLHVLEAEGKDSASVNSDRKRALKHYESAVNQTPPQRRALVLLQMSLLYNSVGDSKKAVAQLSRIVREGTKVYPANSVGNAYANWGDIVFMQGNFGDALKKFEAALPLVDQNRKGYVTYRISWSLLNLGQIEVATQKLIQLLRTPELYGDDAFHEDVSRDLVSFIARGEVTTKRVELLLSLTPDKLKKDNLHALAIETERLGKKREAIYVWNMILDQEADAAARVDGRLRLANLEWSLNNKKETVEQLKEAAAIWNKDGCGKPDECKDAQAKMRKLIIDWNRLEAEQVSPELLAAYQAYLSVINNESDMTLWAAQVARILKKFDTASELYRTSSILAAAELAKKEDPEKRKMFEASLVAQIEMAEASNKNSVKEAAYEHYLKLNPEGARAFEVRYQLAHLHYDTNQPARAAAEFRALALSKNKSELRKKSADLTLDALVLAKDESSIETTALEFSQAVPEGRKEYLNIARRAALKDIAAISNNKKASDADLKTASRRLGALNLEGTTADERKMIYKNQVILAVRTKDLDETDRATTRLLGINDLSPADREFALEKKVWAAEMRLDFSQAYQLTSKMELGKVSQADRSLRLAYLAELSGRNATRHYEDVVASSKQKSKSVLAAVRLVRLAKNPWKALEKYSSLLRGNPEMFASLVLESYARTNDLNRMQKYLAQNSVRRTNAGLTLARIFEVRDINTFDKKIASHRLMAANDRLIQESLKKRLALLKDADQIAAKAIKSKDSTLQIIALSIAARENDRLYNDVLRLPIPRKLTPVQHDAYTRALQAKAQPFKDKALQITAKLGEFWNNSRIVDGMIKNLSQSRRVVARVYAAELKEIARRAPGAQRKQIETAIANADQSRVSETEALAARRALSKDPFSTSAAQELRKAEADLDRDAMVAYLDARLDQLKGDTL